MRAAHDELDYGSRGHGRGCWNESGVVVVGRSVICNDLLSHRGRAIDNLGGLAAAARSIRRGVWRLLAAAAAGGNREGEGEGREREEAGLHGVEHKSPFAAEAPQKAENFL